VFLGTLMLSIDLETFNARVYPRLLRRFPVCINCLSEYI
jgi:hypothetical protein